MKTLSRAVAVLDVLILTNISTALAYGGIGNKTILITAIILSALFFLKINIKPDSTKSENFRLAVLHGGIELMHIFLQSFILNIIAFIAWSWIFRISLGGIITFWTVTLVLSALLVFNGLIRIISTSARLGIVQRLLIIFFWWLPVGNIFIITKACRTAYNEYNLETEKAELNNVRKENEICSTKYPILMVHGVFFRDLKFFNYWGRVPKELIRNGAVIYYGEQHSASSVENCGYEIKHKIEEIVRTTGCGKVNIIAHSKGGLDSRYAISVLGADKYVASLTTVNTPHRGCEYADFLLEHAPKSLKNFLANKYNSTLKSFGEENPDFISAVTDLTAKRCAELNQIMPDNPNVFCQSVGSRMRKSNSAGFPLNIGYKLSYHFGRLDNDGLVDVESMKWGCRHIFFEPKTKRGISHGDVIDLFREDIKGFDIREEFVNIVKDLKDKGF